MISSPSVRMLRACLHFCFEFVDTLHFGDSVHEVVMKFLSPPLRVVELLNARCAETSVWDNAEVLLLVIIVGQGYLALIIKKNLSLYNNFYFR